MNDVDDDIPPRPFIMPDDFDRELEELIERKKEQGPLLSEFEAKADMTERIREDISEVMEEMTGLKKRLQHIVGAVTTLIWITIILLIVRGVHVFRS